MKKSLGLGEKKVGSSHRNQTFAFFRLNNKYDCYYWLLFYKNI